MVGTTQTAHDEMNSNSIGQDTDRGELGCPKLGSETATLEAPAEHFKEDQQPINKRDFGLVPIPKHLRVSKESPPQFDIFLNVLFGIGSTFIVANLYYCQPLLIQLSISFNVTYDEVSRIPTLVQAGYACGLLLITPLGDLVRRRGLILLLITLSASLTIGLPLTSSLHVFEGISFLIGFTSPVPQIMMPFAADLAPPHKRASALSIVLSGLLLGVLFARVLAGVIANFVIWRIVYWIAFGLQVAILALLYFKLPDFPAKNAHMSYFGILYTMAKFAVTEPLLIQCALVNIASMGCFTNFWVTLTFLLGGPIYNYSTLVIGLFGLVGMGGVATVPLLGRLVDRVVPWHTALFACMMQVIFYAIQTGAAGLNVAAVIVVCFGIDCFRQFQQVSLATAIFGLDPAARARLNAVAMISIFIGQIMGTSVGTLVFNAHGWRAAAGVSLAWQSFCVVVLLARGPHCARYTWFGHEGGFAWRKAKTQPAAENQNVASSIEGEEKNTRETGGEGKVEKVDGSAEKQPLRSSMEKPSADESKVEQV